MTTTSTYASWSVEIEELLRATGLWNCAQVLGPDLMTTGETLTLKEKDEIETKLNKPFGSVSVSLMWHTRRYLEVASLARISVRHSEISWKGKNLTPRSSFRPFSTLEEGFPDVDVFSSQLKLSGEDSSTLISNFLRSRSSSCPLWSSPIFRDPNKNSRISKSPFNGAYREWPAARSFETQSWAGVTLARASSV